jgi:hypothetical protein
MRNQKFSLGLTVVLAMIAGNLLGGARARPPRKPSCTTSRAAETEEILTQA